MPKFEGCLERLWRIWATGFCFAVFGAGGLVVRCVVYPLLVLAVRNPARRQIAAKAVIHHSFRFFCRPDGNARCAQL